MPRVPRQPKYSFHATSGHARVYINGRTHWLGPYRSRESRARYEALIEEWERRGHVECSTITVDNLALRYVVDHCETYYRKGGRPTSELAIIRAAARFAVRFFGNTLARDFGTAKLIDVRDEMVKAGLSRTTVNEYVARIRRMFKWGSEKEYVPGKLVFDLRCVAALQKGRTRAVERPKIATVPKDRINAIQEHVSRQIWGIIQIQLLTGARPGEIVSMRVGEIDTSCKVWEYRPASHKTEHRDKDRIILIGPKGQAVLNEFLSEALAADLGRDAFVFSPVDAEAERNRRRRHDRESPMTPSQGARAPRDDRGRRPGDRYTTASYRRAVERACEIAFNMPEGLRKISETASAEDRARIIREAARWRKANAWRPNQLRHSAATDLRRHYGIEGARLILGHESGQTTEIYAEADMKRAQQIALEVG
jgi:integrase